MLKVIAMERFSKAEYCEMALLYGERGRKARSAARLYKKRFSGGPHLLNLKKMKQVRSPL